MKIISNMNNFNYNGNYMSKTGNLRNQPKLLSNITSPVNFGRTTEDKETISKEITALVDEFNNLRNNISDTINNCNKNYGRPKFNSWETIGQEVAMQDILDDLRALKSKYYTLQRKREELSKILEAQNLKDELYKNKIANIDEHINLVRTQIEIAKDTGDDPEDYTLGGLSKRSEISELEKTLKKLRKDSK